MRRARARLLVISALVVGLGAIAPLRAQTLNGNWYGSDDQAESGETMQILAHYLDDGRFAIEYRAYKNCVLTLDQRESGQWAMLDQSTYRLTTNWVDSAALFSVEDFRIEELTAGRLRSVNLRTRIEFAARHVADDFHFPACQMPRRTTGARGRGMPSIVKARATSSSVPAAR